MKKLNINLVKPGDRLAKPVVQENGNVLLGAGVELSDRFIQRLQNLGVDTLFIEDDATEGIEPDEAIRDDTRRQATEAIYKTMTSLMDQPYTKGRAVEPEIGRTFRKVFGEIMQDLIGREHLLVSLSQIQVKDAYLFQHSVNVAILAGIMGMAKGFNRSQMEELGVGAMLFDIGMTQVPKELLDKEGPLSEAERAIVEQHPTAGFDILRKHHDISLLSAHCALQHHERYDGSGYPRGLRSEETHIYAQIVAIADVYDALTSPRPHRKRYTPSETIEFLFAAGNTYFDLDLIKLFCRNISIYPVATTVLLNTGQVGVVSANNPLASHRPKVRIVQEADGSIPKEAYDIDLQDELHIMIVKEL
ncbi:HD-GYP domain-containing protein [Paenibacillus cisolokensis]|jgi:HD-GYP domain|uniref:Phosphodiesterase n=1 Tax=Paenibacillus cisolokensis TaxID=1658519 RepID=A0ABQ4N0W6_9BACL|nr:MULTISPECIES: HD-GYP domain-containing protein [Paenibacillus]ALS26535.1 metal-dependent phosphohydrolase [Paenibacillus sp. 32O-W]GIQ61809.1 phosphodiesterase [Paenibacillus cisolokensis]